LLNDLRRRHLIALGHDGHDRRLPDVLQLAGEEPVAGPDGVAGRDAEADHVDLGERGADQAVQALPE